jgi:hypothetical protein
MAQLPPIDRTWRAKNEKSEEITKEKNREREAEITAVS